MKKLFKNILISLYKNVINAILLHMNTTNRLKVLASLPTNSR